VAGSLDLDLDFGLLPMQIASARSTRVLIGTTFAAVTLALYSGCGDQSSERKGGGEIPDLSAGYGQTLPDAGAAEAGVPGAAGAAGAASTAEGGAAGAGSGGLVPWCDAYTIVNCVCQQCHQNPTLNGAAMPLMTYEDTQAPYPFASSKTLVWEKMQAAVSTRFMPYTGDSSIKPAVKPLSDAQRTTLLAWFAQGAHAEGGTECTMSCNWSDGSPEP